MMGEVFGMIVEIFGMIVEIFGAPYLLCMMFYAGLMTSWVLSLDVPGTSTQHIVAWLFGLLLMPLAPFILGFVWADSNASKLS